MASFLPVLSFGEHHTDFTQVDLEIEALRRVKKYGYDTLAVEYPSDMEPAVQRYLASPRTKADYDVWLEEVMSRQLAAYGAEAPFLTPAERAESIEETRFDIKNILTKKLVEGAADLGYAIRCVDLPVAALTRPEADDMKDLDLRTQGMAEGIAASMGKGVVVVTGLAHLINYELSPSLQTRLAEREIPNWSFALPLDGRTPAQEVDIPEETLAAMVDAVGPSAAQIDGIVGRSLKYLELKAPFERVGLAAEKSPATGREREDRT